MGGEETKREGSERERVGMREDESKQEETMDPRREQTAPARHKTQDARRPSGARLSRVVLGMSQTSTIVCLPVRTQVTVWQGEKYIFADGHTVSNTPDLFRPPKLSGTGPG